MISIRRSLRALGSFSVAAIVTACIVQSQPADPAMQQPAGNQPQEVAQPDDPPQLGGQPAEVAGLSNGEYYCSFTSGRYSYPNFPCIVYMRRDGRQVLEKVGGSQRIHGLVSTTDRGFDFQGTFFCPWGSCTEEVSARFVQNGQSLYQGSISTRTGSAIVVRLEYLPSGFPRGFAGRYGYGYSGARYGYGYGRGRRR